MNITDDPLHDIKSAAVSLTHRLKPWYIRRRKITSVYVEACQCEDMTIPFVCTAFDDYPHWWARPFMWIKDKITH